MFSKAKEAVVNALLFPLYLLWAVILLGNMLIFGLDDYEEELDLI